MAIRKVSDLEYLDVLSVYNSPLSSCLDEMLIETSFPKQLGDKAFISMKMLFGDMANAINAAIVCSDAIVDFYSPVTFHNNLFALCGFYLSGDFYVNKDVDDTQLNQYETIMRSGDTTIFSVNRNLLSSTVENIIAAPSNIICSATQILAKFSDAETFLSSRQGSLTIKYPSISVEGPTNFTGDVTFQKVINGCALCAKWADLAEIYDADEDYQPGTLVKFGGSREITVADDSANAVITTNPGLVLGSQSQSMKFAKGIALIGRVPVKCIGEVKKFDKLVLSKTPGFAESSSSTSSQIVGIALEDSSNSLSSLVEMVVQLSL